MMFFIISHSQKLVKTYLLFFHTGRGPAGAGKGPDPAAPTAGPQAGILWELPVRSGDFVDFPQKIAYTRPIKWIFTGVTPVGMQRGTYGKETGI